MERLRDPPRRLDGRRHRDGERARLPPAGHEVFYSDDHGKTLAPASKDGFDITTAGLPYATLKGCVVGVGMPWVAPTPIAAVAPSAVLAVYPSVENVTVKGMDVARQVAVVVLVAVAGSDPTPIVIPLATIRAKAPDGSVILPALVTDTRAIDSPASMLYWLETTSRPGNPGTNEVKLVARYAMFADADNFPGKRRILSDGEGFKTKNVANFGFGDYMKGTFYYDDALKTRNFVAVWPQQKEDGTVKAFARIITFSDEPLQGPDFKRLGGGVKARSARGMPPLAAPCDTCREHKE